MTDGIIGLRDTSNFIANALPENWRQGIMLLYPNSAEAAKAPLTALTSMLKESSTTDPRFHWFEKELDDRRLELHATAGDLNAPAALTVQTLTLAAGSNALTFVKNDLLLVEHTGEVLRVYSDPVTNLALEVVRGELGTTPTALDANGVGVNPFLLEQGNTFEENSLPPTGVSYNPFERFNFTQIVRRTYEISGTAAETEARTGDTVAEAKRECLEYIGVDIERMLILGVRFSTTQNNHPRRTTGGVVNQLDPANNVSFLNGVVTMAQLEEQMEIIFRFGSYEKMTLCGNRFLLAVNQAVRRNGAAQWMIESTPNKYGLKITKLVTPFGHLNMLAHPLFTQNTGGVTTGGQFFGMTSWGLVLDLPYLKYRYMRNRDLDYEADLQQVGADGLKAGYIGECAMEANFAKTHYLLQDAFTGDVDA